MRNKNILSIAMLTGLMMAMPTQARIFYTATHVGGPDNSIYAAGGYSGQYFDVNNKGQVIMRTMSLRFPKAPMLSFVSIADKWIEINQNGLPPEAIGRIYKIPVDINNKGEVLAIAYTNDDGRHGFVASFSKTKDSVGNVTITQVNRDLGREIIGHAFNDNNQTVGDYRRIVDGQITDVQHAFLDSNGAFTDLGTLGGVNSLAYGINNRGQVTGVSDTAHSESHAFVLGHSRKSAMKDLGTLGGRYSIGKSINDSGQVVGDSTVINKGVEYTHAFVSNKHCLKDLGTLGGNNSFANKVNAKGQIVGKSDIADGTSHAFVTVKDVMVDLNNLVDRKTLVDPTQIDPVTGLPVQVTLTNAISINDKGEILADGFLLTPVPEHKHKKGYRK